tara:strand:- start:585 stop:1127 length:543 start_codon:yes stop_codon:yes gene_type:complete
MKIYTKKGDLGKTSIIGESHIDKHSARIESYGTIDELNSYIGLIRSFNHPKFIDHTKELLFIQDCLFKISAVLASKSTKYNFEIIDSEDTTKVEDFIDNIESDLEPLTSFILPGGDIWSSYAQISRSVCRRAERRITLLNSTEKVHSVIIKFINRLSDYLFVLARKIHGMNNAEEIKWNN